MSTGKSFTIPTIFTAVDKLSGPLGRIQQRMRDFTKSTGLAQVNRQFNALMTPLTAVNRALRGLGVYIGGYLLIRLIGNLIKIFSEFEQANADLAAIMDTTVAKNKALSDNAKLLGLTTAKTATEVVQLQIELAKLNYREDSILNMTKAIVQGSIALDTTGDKLAYVVGTITNIFTEFNKNGSDTGKIVNILSKGANDSALSFENYESALRQSASAAQSTGVNFVQLVAILGALRDSGYDAGSSGTALRNIFLDSSRKGHTWQQVLENISKRQNTLVASADKFGRRTAIAANILVANLDKVKQSTMEWGKVTDDYTDLIAAKKLDTYKGSLLLLKGAYQGLILSVEDGTGKYAHFLKRINQVGRAILLLLNDSAAARGEFNKQDKRTQELAKTFLFWLKVIGWVTAALITAKVILVAWDLAIGLFTIGMEVATGVMWLFNLAMAANPIGLIILAVEALLVLLAAMVQYWNEWGAALSLFIGPLGLIVSLIQSFRRNWTQLMSAFSNEGFIAGIKKLGAIIIDMVLMPLQQIFKIVHDITGFKWADDAAKGIEKFRNLVGVNTATDESGNPIQGQPTPVVDNTKAQQDWLHSLAVDKQKADIRLFLNDPKGRLQAESDSSFVKIIPQLSSTFQGWQNKDR